MAQDNSSSNAKLSVVLGKGKLDSAQLGLGELKLWWLILALLAKYEYIAQAGKTYRFKTDGGRIICPSKDECDTVITFLEALGFDALVESYSDGEWVITNTDTN